MQDFMNNGSFTAACLKGSYQSLKMYLFSFWECKICLFREKNEESEGLMQIHSIVKCIITKNYF